MIDQIGVNGVYNIWPIAQNANSTMYLCHKLVTARHLCGGVPTKVRVIPLSYRHFIPNSPRYLVCNDEELGWLCDVLNGDVDFLSFAGKEMTIYDQAD